MFNLDACEAAFDAVHTPADAELWFWTHAVHLLDFARERSDRVIELETGTLPLPDDLPEFKL